MSWLVFLFGLVLLAMAGVSAKGAVDLLPTELGLFYANAAALAACAGIITLSIGALIRRVDALGRKMAFAQTIQMASKAFEDAATAIDAAPEASEPSGEPIQEPAAAASSPAEPSLIGRRTANGVNYAIYADGSVEVNTPDGVRRYASIAVLRASMAPAGEPD